MSIVWEHSRASGNALLVMLAIADYADHRGWAWPSMATIARKARCSVRRAQANVRFLKDVLGELEVSDRAAHKGCNRYRVTLQHPGKISLPGNSDTRKNVTEGDASIQWGDASVRGGDVIAPAKSSCEVTLASQGGDASVTRSVIDPSVQVQRERREASPGGKRGRAARPTAGRPDLAVSKAQFTALRERIREAEKRIRMDGLKAGEVGVLKKMRAALGRLQKKQAAGDFTAIDLGEFGL